MSSRCTLCTCCLMRVYIRSVVYKSYLLSKGKIVFKIERDNSAVSCKSPSRRKKLSLQWRLSAKDSRVFEFLELLNSSLQAYHCRWHTSMWD